MSESNTSITFKIFRDETFLREETLSVAVIKIGKLSSSHLRLDDDSVSRMHAVVEVSNKQVSIIDLGSTTGTRVNGQKINKAVLHDGDTVIIGDVRLEAVISIPVAVAEFTPAQTHEVQPVSATPLPVPVPMFEPQAPAMPSIAFADGTFDASAIEVTAMLGDSVVGVKHVVNPRAGRVRPLTYGIIAGGLLLLVLSSVAFYSGVGTAAHNKERFEAHVAAKRVAHEFRPSRLSTAFDWMALGGLAGGLLCMTWGLLRIREERVQPRFRIGHAPGVDLPTADSPLKDLSLVAPDGDSFVFNFAEGWQGNFAHGGHVTKLSDLPAQGLAQPSASIPGAWQVPILANTNIQVTAGAQKFTVRSVAQPRRQATPIWMQGNTELFSYIGASAVVIIGFVLMLDGLQPDETTLGGDAFDSSTRMAHLISTAPEDAIEEPPVEKKGAGEAADGTGTKMAMDSGKMGSKESKKATGQFAMKNTGMPPALARQMARDRAMDSGILGVWARSNGGAFESLTATANFYSGLDDRDVYGGLLGSEVGEMAGPWCHGVEGVGPGADGDGWGTIGTGNYGLIGHSEGTGTGYKPGHGKGELRRHKASPPKVTIGPIDQNGDLDPSIIRRYVRKKLSRIRYCYEKELVVSPRLSGTVVTQFTISPMGIVQSVKARGLGNPGVESCVSAAIESIQFPKPKDGGYVNVRSYPFTFQPAGAE
ncbi:MAG: AgmX/PglI C-terminal domain-containing protein [Myxococcales bacterium]|nr:AgmX/PglI C-terminal domain-containing protein [Myxococcales bacterium]